jgi:uncharacterized membrane protein HdeD (DUF308 family)
VRDNLKESDMLNSQPVGVHEQTAWSIVLSMLMIVAGLLAIGLPMMTGIAVGAVIAWLLLFSGALHVAFAWRGHGAAGVLWEILLGLAYGVIGLYLVAHPLAELASLTLVVAIYLFVEALLECVLWFQLRALPARGWLLLDGMITFALAVMIGSTWPSSSAWVIGTLVGISMLFSGISRLVPSFSRRVFPA